MVAAKAIENFTKEWNRSPSKRGKPWIWGRPTPWGHSLMWERRPGDWLEIPATRKTREAIGEEADLMTIHFQNEEKSARLYKRQVQLGPTGSKREVTREAEAESRRILAAYGSSPLVDKTAKRAARARLRQQEDVEQFTKHVSAAGAPVPSPPPSTPLPRNILDATLRPQTTVDNPYAAASLRKQWQEFDDEEGDNVRK